MRLISVFRSPTSPTKLKFVFCLILVEGALCIQTQANSSAKNTTEKDGPDRNGTGSDRSVSNEPIKPEVITGLERKDSKLQSPAPIYEITTESEEHTGYTFENDAVNETISPVDEVYEHSTTESNQGIDIQESSRESVEFRPSVHLGQIGEISFTGTMMNPFNKVQHIAFQNGISPGTNIGKIGTHPQSVRQKTVKFYDTDNGYKPETVKVQPIQLSEYIHKLQNQQNLQIQHHQNDYAESGYAHRTPVHDTRFIQGILSMRPMAFDGANYNLETTERPYYYVNAERPYPESVEKPYHVENVQKPYHTFNSEKPCLQAHLEKPYSFVNTETPYHYVFEKPTKFQNEEKNGQPLYTQGYEYIKPLQYDHLKKPEIEYEHFQKPEFHIEHFRKPEFNLEYFKKPEVSVDYLQPGLHGSSEHFGNTGKHENTVYITTHEATHTRTKKYPYQFHSPLFATELPVLHEDHSHEYESHEKRVSPWKKIIHLLGAAIPLGLLFAALTPHVVNVNQDNPTEPNIVLAKLRDLPREHKEGRFTDSRDMCEERSICELILGGASPKSNFAQNILWNLSKRITDEVAQKNGLQEIFDSVKRKDCSSLTCETHRRD